MTTLILIKSMRKGEDDVHHMVSQNEMIPFLAVASNNFDKDLAIIRKVLNNLEKRVHSEEGYRLSTRAEMAAGWWFYDVFVTRGFLLSVFQTILPPNSYQNKGTAALKIIDMLQNQIKKYGSEAKINIHREIPFAGPWWAWLMR